MTQGIHLVQIWTLANHFFGGRMSMGQFIIHAQEKKRMPSSFPTKRIGGQFPSSHETLVDELWWFPQIVIKGYWDGTLQSSSCLGFMNLGLTLPSKWSLFGMVFLIVCHINVVKWGKNMWLVMGPSQMSWCPFHEPWVAEIAQMVNVQVFRDYFHFNSAI